MPLTMALLSYAFLDCLPAGFREQMRTVCMPSSCPHCASLRAPHCQRRSWLRANFSQPMKVDVLAELVHMSVSSIKSVTSMSQLQCQKVLRLQEARRIMLYTMMDSGLARHREG